MATTRRGFLGLLGATAGAVVALPVLAKLAPVASVGRGPFEVNTSPLVEGKIPTLEDLRIESINDPVLDDIVRRLGEQAVRTRENIMWNVLTR